MSRWPNPDKLAVGFAVAVASVEAIIGLIWVLASPSHLAGPTYKPAIELFRFLPGSAVYWWGFLLLFLALGALISMARRRDAAIRVFYAAMVGYWTFWALLFAVAFFSLPAAGPAAMGLALIAAIGNARPVLGLPLLERV